MPIMPGIARMFDKGPTYLRTIWFNYFFYLKKI